MKNAYVLCIITVVLLSACKKSNTDEDRDNNCNLSRLQIYLDSASTSFLYSQIIYSYSGDKVTKKTESSSDVNSTFEYNGNRIVKILHRCTGISSCYADEVLHYNSDGTLRNIDIYNLSSFGNPIKDFSYQFYYSNAKISRIIQFAFDQTNNPPDSAIERVTNFTYTNSNITKLETELFSGEKMTFIFSYDNKNNYLNQAYKGNWLMLAHNYGWFDDSILPAILSTNNVTNVTLLETGQPTVNFAINYKLDNKGNLSEFLIMRSDGYKTSYKYEYTCP